MRLTASAIATALALAALVAAPMAGAQTLSAEEMKKRFSAHRGLSLAPVSPAKPAAASGTSGTTTAATAPSTAPSTGASGVSPATPSAPAAPRVTTGGASGSGADAASTTLSAAPARTDPAGSPVAMTAQEEISAIAAAYRPVPEELRVDIQIQFEFDSAVLRDTERAKLDTVCGAMKDSDIELFHIFGHTDAAGSASYNLTLSQLRADEVRRYLVSNCGIDAGRLKAIGVGKEHLLDAANPRAPENRRVEFQAIS
jgi:outer membrane protein OmpA-like peptidoglycan-associated protein